MTLVTVMLLILHICTFMETRREIKQEEKNMEEEEIMDEYEDNDELDDKELIIIVKANPFLCNKSEKLYSNIEIKKLAWTAIGERLSKKKTGKYLHDLFTWVTFQNVLSKENFIRYTYTIVYVTCTIYFE